MAAGAVVTPRPCLRCQVSPRRNSHAATRYCVVCAPIVVKEHHDKANRAWNKNNRAHVNEYRRKRRAALRQATA